MGRHHQGLVSPIAGGGARHFIDDRLIIPIVAAGIVQLAELEDAFRLDAVHRPVAAELILGIGLVCLKVLVDAEGLYRSSTDILEQRTEAPERLIAERRSAVGVSFNISVQRDELGCLCLEVFGIALECLVISPPVSVPVDLVLPADGRIDIQIDTFAVFGLLELPCKRSERLLDEGGSHAEASVFGIVGGIGAVFGAEAAIQRVDHALVDGRIARISEPQRGIHLLLALLPAEHVGRPAAVLRGFANVFIELVLKLALNIVERAEECLKLGDKLLYPSDEHRIDALL